MEQPHRSCPAWGGGFLWFPSQASPKSSSEGGVIWPFLLKPDKCFHGFRFSSCTQETEKVDRLLVSKWFGLLILWNGIQKKPIKWKCYLCAINSFTQTFHQGFGYKGSFFIYGPVKGCLAWGYVDVTLSLYLDIRHKTMKSSSISIILLWLQQTALFLGLLSCCRISQRARLRFFWYVKFPAKLYLYQIKERLLFLSNAYSLNIDWFNGDASV